jgi:hypothetical protein
MIEDDFRGMPQTMTTACGSTAFLDLNASYPAYRCYTCLTVYGSVGMPDFCREAMLEQQVFKMLKESE